MQASLSVSTVSRSPALNQFSQRPYTVPGFDPRLDILMIDSRARVRVKKHQHNVQNYNEVKENIAQHTKPKRDLPGSRCSRGMAQPHPIDIHPRFRRARDRRKYCASRKRSAATKPYFNDVVADHPHERHAQVPSDPSSLEANMNAGAMHSSYCHPNSIRRRSTDLDHRRAGL